MTFGQSAAVTGSLWIQLLPSLSLSLNCDDASLELGSDVEIMGRCLIVAHSLGTEVC